MKQLNNVVRLALILLLSVGSTALKEKDPKNPELLSKEIARQLTSMASMAPTGNPFTEVASLPGVNWGDMAWGDYDNDGDFDVVVTGNSGTLNAQVAFTKLYKNTGGVFAEDTSNPLMQFVDGSCDWGDYDGDGDIDLLITGYTNTTVLAAGTAIYNNNNGILTMITTPDLSGAGYSTCSWVDVDSDGDLDATVMGLFVTPPSSVSDLGTLLRNDGNNVFTRSFNFLGADQGDAVWADYDNDKDMDVLVTGGFNNTTININNVTSNFSVSSLDGLSTSGAVWGDFDADGDPDLIVTGTKYNSGVGTINVYKNDGSGKLTLLAGTAGLTAHYETSITAGDYDNDGDLDILLTGFTAPISSTNADLYKNDGTGNFTQVSSPGFNPVLAGEAKWADYDNDGDLDLILSGGTDSNYDGVTKIYRNDLNPTNTKPNTPTGLTLTQSGTSLNFSWNTTSDAEGGKVTYNLRVGATPDGSEIMSTSSNLATGYHRIATPGNVQGTTSWRIQNSTASKIYWSVQAIDNSLLGGNFATEASLIHQLPITGFAADPGNQKVNLSWTNPNSNGFATIYRETAPTSTPSNIIASSLSSSTYTDNTAANGNTYYYYIISTDNNGSQSTLVSVSAIPGIFTMMQSLAGITGAQGRNMWGDYDHDGDYDIFVTGDAGAVNVTSNEITKIYNNTSGTFIEATNITLAAVPYGWASWNDYDNDNDLDVLITSSYGQYSSNLYQNTNGAFNDVTAPTKLQPAGGYHGWADWDNDGDMDLAVAQGNASFTARNDRAAGFSPAFQFDGGNNLKWADYDNDGDLDFVMFGQADSYVIFNNDKGVLTKIESSNLIVNFGFDCAWVDVDNDGKLDLIGSGNYSDGYLKVYKNTGAGFSVFSNVGSAGLMFTTLAVGDYDNDGDADIALTGISYVTYNSFTKLLSNDGSGHYTEVANTILPNVSESTLAWCDYDHDGDLDLLLSGGGDDNSIITKVFRNNLNVSNAPPSVPAGLQASVGNTSATFNWNSSTDTQGGAITYNLRVGTTPNGSEILSPMADVSTGMLLAPSMGNVQLNRSWTLNLPKGTYYWSVQSVDGAYAASNFAAEQQLVVDYPTTTGIVDQTLTYGDSKSIDLSSSFVSTSAINYGVAIANTTTASATIQGSSLSIAALNAGATTVTVTATESAGGSNTTSFTITVKKAPLQIIADDETAVYHGTYPAYTYKVTGLKLTDTESVIPTTLTVTGPDGNFNAGTYPIIVNVGVGTAVNYDITTVNGTMTIDKAAGQVTLGALAQNFVNSPRAVTVTVIPTGLEVDVTYSGSSTAPTAIGSYDVVATINDINYQGSATGTLVISAVTAVEDLSKLISVYPNPIKDELYVDASGLEKARVSIVDMLGQEVRSQNLESAVTMVDCRTLSSGMFLVIVYDASNRKVMIAKAVKI